MTEDHQAEIQMSFVAVLRIQPEGTRLQTVWDRMAYLWPEYNIEEIKKACMPVAKKIVDAHL